MVVSLIFRIFAMQFIKERIMSKEYTPSEEEIKELALEPGEVTTVDGFTISTYVGDFHMGVYEKKFETKDFIEFVLQDPRKGIVFIGQLKSFVELKDQLERCQLS